MADRFSNYTELSKAMKIDRDYRIDLRSATGARMLIAAPHGGKIEHGTSEIANRIAGTDYCFYAFEGIRRFQNRDLHITSHNFDEPQAVELAKMCDFILGVHGRRDEDDKETIYIGGLDETLTKFLEIELRTSGFSTSTTDHPFPAINRKNICNRGVSGEGAQVEIPATLRRQLLKSTKQKDLEAFTGSIRAAIKARLQSV